MIEAFVKAASGISTMWSLAAFTVAAVLYLTVGRRKEKSNAGVQVTSALLLLFAAIPIVGSLLADVYKTRPSVYELRVTVEPLPRRSDPGALVDQLLMSPEERMQSAAALHNAMAEMRAGLSG